MDAILVIDTGGSKCEIMLLDLEGHILGWGHNAMLGVGGRNIISISNALRETLGDVERHFETVYLITLGLLVPLKSLRNYERIDYIPGSEWEAAMAHANLQQGVVLLAGTGAFAHATTADGRERHLDGGGPILGDFGGGYHIGWLAIQAAFRADWHPRHATSLRDRVLDAFSIKRPMEMIDLALFSRDRSLVASVARIVSEEATKGDAVACRIIDKAATALAETFRDLVTVLQIENDAYTVVGTGSLIRHCELYRTRLWEKIAEIAPRFTTLHLLEPPVVSLGIDALRRIRGTAADPAIATLLAEVSNRTS